MKFEEKQKAVVLRTKGYSLNEISNLLGVAKSSVSVWVRNISLSTTAKQRLLSVIRSGQYIAAEKKKSATLNLNNSITQEAKTWIDNIHISKDAEKIICAMIYWCEGAKDYRNGIAFTNSDPQLTRLFIDLLEKDFQISRKRAVAVLHLHQYHDHKLQTIYWAKALNISKTQFRKFYLKPNTGQRTRDNYPGCISLRYYDNILSRKLMAIAKNYTQMGV